MNFLHSVRSLLKNLCLAVLIIRKALRSRAVFEVAINSEKDRVQKKKARQDARRDRVHAEAERKSAKKKGNTAEGNAKSATWRRYVPMQRVQRENRRKQT